MKNDDKRELVAWLREMANGLEAEIKADEEKAKEKKTVAPDGGQSSL